MQKVLAIVLCSLLSVVVNAKASKPVNAKPGKMTLEVEYSHGKNYKYTVEAMFDKNNVVSGSQVVILKEAGDTVISGKYFYDEDKKRSIIEGIMIVEGVDEHFITGAGSGRIAGQFNMLTNTKNVRLSKKNRKWNGLQFEPVGNVDVLSCVIKRGSLTITVNQGELVVEMKVSNSVQAQRIKSSLPSGAIKVRAMYPLSMTGMQRLAMHARANAIGADSDSYGLVINEVLSLDNCTVIYDDGTEQDIAHINLSLHSDKAYGKGPGVVRWLDGTIVTGEFSGDYNVMLKPTPYLLINGTKNFICTLHDGYEFDRHSVIKCPDWADSDRWYEIKCNARTMSDLIKRLNDYKVEHEAKVEAEERAKADAEAKKRVAYEKRLSDYTLKYGTRFAEAILAKRVERGMTKQMLKEFLPEEFYVVTRSDNNEVWRFSEKKAETAMYSSKESLEMLMIIKMFGGSVGGLIRAGNVLGGADVPQKIVFTGGRISGITR